MIKVPTDKPLFPTETVLKALDIDKKLLLYYEENKIIKPEKIKEKSYYSIDDLEKLRQIIYNS